MLPPSARHRISSPSLDYIDFVRRRSQWHDVCKKKPLRACTRSGLNLVKLSSPDAPSRRDTILRGNSRGFIEIHTRAGMCRVHEGNTCNRQHPVHVRSHVHANLSVSSWNVSCHGNWMDHRKIGVLYVSVRPSNNSSMSTRGRRIITRNPVSPKKTPKTYPILSRWFDFLCVRSLVRSKIGIVEDGGVCGKTRCSENWTDATKDGVHENGRVYSFSNTHGSDGIFNYSSSGSYVDLSQ